MENLKYLKNYKVIEEINIDNLVKVSVINGGWQPVHFIFSDNYITCYGDISSYTWRCTWYTAQQIRYGRCWADNPFYLSEKLEHQQELKEFDDDKFTETMEEIKQEYLDDLYTKKEKDEFLEKWEDNECYLCGIDGYRLGDLDTFFNNMEISDYYEYYDDFYVWPVHYHIALEMLLVIEEYFKEKNKAQGVENND